MRIRVPILTGKQALCQRPVVNYIMIVMRCRYRLAVLRALPQLQKLDNVQVTQEELREAQRKGRILTHPEEQQESEEDEEEEEEYISSSQPQYSRYQNEYATEQEYSPPQRSPSRQEVVYTNVIVLNTENEISNEYYISNIILTILTRCGID